MTAANANRSVDPTQFTLASDGARLNENVGGLMSTPATNLETVILPKPALSPTATLEQALKSRHSSRAFLPDPLSLELLSALLWTGFGINRRDTGGRTAPSAHNWQEIDVFAVLPEGAYRYDAKGHRLLLVKAEDLRGATGVQDFVATAPLNLVYVADFARMPDARAEERDFLAGADAGCRMHRAKRLSVLRRRGLGHRGARPDRPRPAGCSTGAVENAAHHAGADRGPARRSVTTSSRLGGKQWN